MPNTSWLKDKIKSRYRIISKVLRNLDEAIAYIKRYPENYSESYLDINKPSIEQELRNELHQVWTKPIYRMIAVDDKKELNRDNLGRYWTYNKDRAKAYWGSGDHRARITARVKESDIDWLETVEMHLNPKYVNEDEVRLLEKAKPIILKVEWIRVKSHKAIMKKILSNNDDEIGSGKHALTTDKSGKFWGDAGAGGVFYSTKTKRFLLAFRSEYVNEPRTWGVWGGAIDKNETPTEAIKREIREETGYRGHYKLIPSFIYKKDDFQYHNFIIEVEEEFKPKLCWETENYGWFEINNFPAPLHFGLKALLPYLKKI